MHTLRTTSRALLAYAFSACVDLPQLPAAADPPSARPAADSGSPEPPDPPGTPAANSESAEPPAPVLRLADAVARLDATGLGHLFFADRETGRGRLLYRRFDHRYGLIADAA